MRRRFRILIVLASTLAMVLMLNVGTAFADHTGGTEWTCDTNAGAAEGGFCPEGGGANTDGAATLIGPAALNAFEPVGRHVFAPGAKASDAAREAPRNGIVNNPLCPLHEVVSTE